MGDLLQPARDFGGDNLGVPIDFGKSWLAEGFDTGADRRKIKLERECARIAGATAGSVKCGAG